MRNQLAVILDWPARFARAGWCVHLLAQQCDVCATTLERHFRDHFHVCPKEWIRTERMRRAGELLVDGGRVKETATVLGYANQHHFSAAFKKFYGYPPRWHRKLMAERADQILQHSPSPNLELRT